MSRWSDFAEGLAAHLRSEVPELAGESPAVEVIVLRKKSLLSAVEASTSKQSGCCVVIAWLGGKNPDKRAKRLQLGGLYSVSVWTLPDLTEIHEDDLMEKVLDASHGFVLATGPNDLTRRLEMEGPALVPDPKFLIYEAKGEVKRLGPIS